MILNTAAAAHLSTFAPLVDKVMLQEMRDLIAPEELLAMASTLLVGPASDLEILGSLLRPPAHGDVAGQAHKPKGGAFMLGLHGLGLFCRHLELVIKSDTLTASHKEHLAIMGETSLAALKAELSLSD